MCASDPLSRDRWREDVISEAVEALEMLERLAKAILTLAAAGGMPDTFWSSDSRIQLACEVLGWDYEVGRAWGRDNC